MKVNMAHMTVKGNKGSIVHFSTTGRLLSKTTSVYQCVMGRNRYTESLQQNDILHSSAMQ